MTLLQKAGVRKALAFALGLLPVALVAAYFTALYQLNSSTQPPSLC